MKKQIVIRYVVKMFSQLEPYFSAFEGYLTAPDKDDYFQELADPTSKELLDILIAPLYSVS
jgi:hypothetical protein